MNRYDISPLSPGETIMRVLVLLGFEEKLSVGGSRSCVSRAVAPECRVGRWGALLGLSSVDIVNRHTVSDFPSRPHGRSHHHRHLKAISKVFEHLSTGCYRSCSSLRDYEKCWPRLSTCPITSALRILSSSITSLLNTRNLEVE